MKAAEYLAGEDAKPRDMHKVKQDLEELHSVFFPQAAVHPTPAGQLPTSAPVAPVSKVQSLAERYGILKPQKP